MIKLLQFWTRNAASGGTGISDFGRILLILAIFVILALWLAGTVVGDLHSVGHAL
jgi:hypothetical protein